MRKLLMLGLLLMCTVPAVAQVDTAWVRRYNGPGNSDEWTTGMVVDRSGNVYVTGCSGGDYATLKYYSNGDTAWVRRYNGSGNNVDCALDLKVDDSGNVYVTGYSTGSGTNWDIVTIKYFSNGDTAWLRRYSSSGNQEDVGFAIAVDNSGNVYVTGRREGVYPDYVTIKYNINGGMEWIKTYNGPGNYYDIAMAIAVDGSGNVYVTGKSWNGANYDYATIKYYSTGGTAWERRYNGPANRDDAAMSIVIDSSGNAYVNGYSYGSGAYSDYTTIKYYPNGDTSWVRRYRGCGSCDDDDGRALAVDRFGNVYVAGGNDEGTTNGDYITLRYYPDGDTAWVRRYNGLTNEGDAAYDIALDDHGNVYVTGLSYHNSLGGFATIKYDSIGNQIWVTKYNGPGNSDWALAIAVDDSSNVFVAGPSYGNQTGWDYATIKYFQTLERVDVTAGSNQNGYADSIVSVLFFVQNVGVVLDSYSVDIWDTRGWNVVPVHYDLVLDTAQAESVSFVVTIPYVPLGTIDQVTLLAVSKTNSLARDSASLTVTCNAYVEGWSITSGDDISTPAHSHGTTVFYVQNTGLAPDSCYLNVSDSLGWIIQPQSYNLALNPGQQDSVSFDVQIPSIPVGTRDKITLVGGSLTNPFVMDSASLLVTCNSYNVRIRRVFDVGNDQGKQVRIDWTSFPGSDPLVTEFSVFRRKDSLLTTSLAPLVSDVGLPAYPPGQWDWLVTIPAFGETLYSMVAPTLRDSTIAEGMYWSAFFIRAGTNIPTVYFDSPVDSGYSLDNLVPSPPTGLLASHAPATTKLRWSATSAPDFDYYTIYRDTVSGFAPNPSNRFGFTIDTTYVDTTAQLGRTYFYLVSATDFSGNESNPSNEAMGVRYMTGDANADGKINSSDVVYLINYLFVQGPEPVPLEAGDVNCDGKVDASDVVYLINYSFINGPPPCDP